MGADRGAEAGRESAAGASLREPLYPGKRGSFAWEPFSDDSMFDEMTVRPDGEAVSPFGRCLGHL